ncbi:MAG: L-lactate dehydrogenase [Ruminococcaceae bacterium]|nr:L-lactate dehydrogenase [Oscillospiraceae bacterium]
MKSTGKKVVLIGTGMVGMSFAYSALNQHICDELVLIDIDTLRAQGEAMDLNHGLAFSSASMKISPGDYSQCKDADIVVICAGVNQQDKESRLELLGRNAQVFCSIVPQVVSSGFRGIFLVATNPVDIMTRITYELSGFEEGRVIGTGTTLDTARLRYLMGEYFRLDPRNVHAYVIGEHGDSEFTPWSQALLATKPVYNVLEDNPDKFFFSDLENISNEVRLAAHKIIKAKRATYYGIGMSINRIVRAILSDEQSVLTVSGLLRGEYGRRDVFIGNPCIIGRDGINRTIELTLTKEELEKFHNSCDIIDRCFSDVKGRLKKASPQGEGFLKASP